MTIENILEDLDSALKLLDEYTSRTRGLYAEIESHKRQKLTFIYLFTATATFLVFAFLILNDYLMAKSTIFYILVGGFFFIFSFAVLFLFFLRKQSSSATTKIQLSITVKQLKQLVNVVSQFTQHNNNSLSELKRYELNLRLIEAEEAIRLVRKSIDLRDFERHNSNYF